MFCVTQVFLESTSPHPQQSLGCIKITDDAKISLQASAEGFANVLAVNHVVCRVGGKKKVVIFTGNLKDFLYAVWQIFWSETVGYVLQPFSIRNPFVDTLNQRNFFFFITFFLGESSFVGDSCHQGIYAT